MVLESTMICLDNSDWMRNGDYLPSRLEAQQDAAGIICNDRTNSNPENTVGILTMAGNGVDLRCSPTEEPGKILASFAGINIGGKSDLSTAVQIAQLALKHRKNKNGGQRIIAFVGGPVFESIDKLQKIGKQLKKNNVAVDIISIGEMDENNEKLLEFVNATNSNDNSHLITVPPGVSPVNAILSSPIMHIGGMSSMSGSGGIGSMDGGGGDSFDMYGGIDPSMDPELAMAIRVSTEEARAQEEARVKQAQEQSTISNTTSSSTTIAAPAASSSSSNSILATSNTQFPSMTEDDEDEDALIQRALEMSMREMMNMDTLSGGNNIGDEQDADGNDNEDYIYEDEDQEMDEDEELMLALQLSVAESNKNTINTIHPQQVLQPSTTSTVATTNNPTSAFVDNDFVAQLLSSADQNDPLIKEALAQIMSSNNNTSNTTTTNNNNEKENDDDSGGTEENSKKRKGT